jgi:hypothetical protein
VPTLPTRSRNGPRVRAVPRSSQWPTSRRPLGRQQPPDRPDQARLADAGLAGDEHQPALAGRRLAGGLGELGELAVAFEKHRPCHIASIAGALIRDHGQSARLQMDLACSRWVPVDPDGHEGTRRIVRMIIGMIKTHPTKNRMARRAERRGLTVCGEAATLGALGLARYG